MHNVTDLSLASIKIGPRLKYALQRRANLQELPTTAKEAIQVLIGFHGHSMKSFAEEAGVDKDNFRKYLKEGVNNYGETSEIKFLDVLGVRAIKVMYLEVANPKSSFVPRTRKERIDHEKKKPHYTKQNRKRAIKARIAKESQNSVCSTKYFPSSIQ